MLFSICIPVYNAKDYLYESVHSVLSQSFQDFEIVMIDDGSTDGSGELCDQFAGRHSDKIRVIHNQENKGLLLARRFFFQYALGEWFLSVDADDQMAEGALEKIQQAIQNNDCDLILFDLVCIHMDDHKERYTVPLKDKHIYSGEEKKSVYEQIHHGNNINSMCTKAIKRSIVDSEVDYTQWKALQLGEDLFQTYPILDRAAGILYLKEPLYYYMKREHSLTNIRAENWYEQKLILWGRDDEYLKKWNANESEEQKVLQRRLKGVIIYLDQLFATEKDTLKRKCALEIIRKDGIVRQYYDKVKSKKRMKKRYRMYLFCLFRRQYQLLGMLCCLYYLINRCKTFLINRQKSVLS